MARHRRPVVPAPVALLAAVVGVYALAWAWSGLRAVRRRVVRLETAQSAYFHDQFVDLRLLSRDPALVERWRSGPPPRAAVLRDGAVVPTIAGVRWVDLRYDERSGEFRARWPCPWNAPPGAYTFALAGAGELADRLRVRGFEIRRRVPRPLPRGFVALTLETSKPLAEMRVRGPDGDEKDWRGLLDWAQYVEADAFWMLVGETPGASGETWRNENLGLVPQIAQECRRRGLRLGVYAMNYLTTSKVPLPRYEYAWDVSEGRAFLTRAISLRDPRRPGDVAELLRRFKDLPGVDFVGLDYIRNALGGYELVDDFFAEMPGVRPPPEWPRLSREERMVWFHRKKVMHKDRDFIDAWQWWRAHRVGQIVRRIRSAVGPDKTLWAFTLTWDKGWNHGQDPVMMNDAGVDADALMLYEADDAQFEQILKDFSRYVRRPDVQLVVGDIVDWRLHQRSPLGPRELGRRLTQGVDRVYGDGQPAVGIFVHDAARAVESGHLGPYTTRQWMDEARRAIRHLRDRHAAAATLVSGRPS